MKRIVLLGLVSILVMALFAPVAMGAVKDNPTAQNAQNQAYFEQMMQQHQNWLDQAQKDGRITPEQAKAWQKHFNNMRDFYSQNGYYPYGMMGGGMMMGNGYGMMGPGYMMDNAYGNNGYRGMMGNGYGMMGGWCW